MQQDNITPEEKLLKIIENPARSSLKQKIHLPGGSFLSKFKTLPVFAKNKIKIKEINLHTLNQVLIGLGILLSAVLIFVFIKQSFGFSMRLKNIAAGASLKQAENKKTLVLDAGLKEMLSEASKRNMFSFIPPKPASATMQISVEIAQIIANLKLVGVIWSDKPQAMIEDSKEKKTYLLSAGEQIGVITIEKIFKDKVVLKKGDQEWELR